MNMPDIMAQLPAARSNGQTNYFSAIDQHTHVHRLQARAAVHLEVQALKVGLVND